MNRAAEGKSSGIPHLAKNERDTRISCTRHQPAATCAAFIEESRMKFTNANTLHRQSGGVGHPSLSEETGRPKPRTGLLRHSNCGTSLVSVQAINQRIAVGAPG